MHVCSTLSNKYGEARGSARVRAESGVISAEIGNMFVLKIDDLNSWVLVCIMYYVGQYCQYGRLSFWHGHCIYYLFVFPFPALFVEERRVQWITIFREGFALHPNQTLPNKYLSTVNKILATTWNIKCSILQLLPLHN